MAKAPNSAIGVDLGRYSLKSVLLQRKSVDRFTLSHHATRVVDESLDDPARLGAELRSLLKEMGGSARACAIGVSSSEALLRIIDQPETPVKILRDALRLNGMALLNQDCKPFVLDCDLIASSDVSPEPAFAGLGAVPHHRYLVGGLPRARVAQINEAFPKSRGNLSAIQLAPVCVFNAFEFAMESVFNDEAFVLVDIGHLSSSVAVGVKKELILVRSIDYGSKNLLDALINQGENSRSDVLRRLHEEDEVTLMNARSSLTALTREIASSIGFFEGRREELMGRIFVSGAAAASPAVLNIMTQELKRPCEAWNPFSRCEVTLPPPQKATIAAEFSSLAVACGAAAEILKGP